MLLNSHNLWASLFSLGIISYFYAMLFNSVPLLSFCHLTTQWFVLLPFHLQRRDLYGLSWIFIENLPSAKGIRSQFSSLQVQSNGGTHNCVSPIQSLMQKKCLWNSVHSLNPQTSPLTHTHHHHKEHHFFHIKIILLLFYIWFPFKAVVKIILKWTLAP